VEFSASMLESLAGLVDEGKVYPVVDKIFSPQDAVLALQHCDSVNAIGKTVIRFRYGFQFIIICFLCLKKFITRVTAASKSERYNTI